MADFLKTSTISLQIPAHSLALLFELLRCVHCGAALSRGEGCLTCISCGGVYPLQYDQIPSFLDEDGCLTSVERLEIDNLGLQMSEYYSPDWRTGYNPARVALIDHTLPDGLILDVGAADGQIAAHLTTQRRTVFGIEKSSQWIEKHQKLEVPFAVGDVYRIPFDRETFDGVILGEVLEHLYDPQLALSRTVDVLKRDGILVGTVPNFCFLTKRFRYLAGKFGEGSGNPLTHGHIRFFSYEVLKRLLEQAGLRDIKITGILKTEVPSLPFMKIFNRMQMFTANLMPELLAVTFFFQARKP